MWGTSSQTTAFRNWVVGTTHICMPTSGRGTVNLLRNQRALWIPGRSRHPDVVSATLNNFVGNVVGSAQMQSLIGYSSTAGTIRFGGISRRAEL